MSCMGMEYNAWEVEMITEGGWGRNHNWMPKRLEAWKCGSVAVWHGAQLEPMWPFNSESMG